MKRSKFMRIGLIVTSVLIFIGVALMAWLLATKDDRNVIKLDLDDGTEPILFESLCLIPGQQCMYTIRMNSEMAKKCDLTLDFTELEEKTLKNFAYVRIEANGQILYDQLLADAFEDQSIVMSADFTNNKNTELTIIYYLPIEVGNEAQNAEAFFELLITASNE